MTNAQMQASYTIVSGESCFVVRDDETGNIVGRVPSASKIDASSDSHDVVGACRYLMQGNVDSIDHDKDTIHVSCTIPAVE